VRGLAVGIVGAAVILASVTGLAVGWARDGPIDADLDTAVVLSHVTGTVARRPDSSVLGLCPSPPCGPETSIDLRFASLPTSPYVASMAGPGGEEPLGPLLQEGGEHVLRWSAAEDHADKDRIVVRLAGRQVAEGPLLGGAGTMAVDWYLLFFWELVGVSDPRVHLNEIGGVSVSTVALMELEEAPPEGWEFRAHLEGSSGRVALGALEDGKLDGRVERVRLEDQDRFIVTLARADAPVEEGFPVLQATAETWRTG